MASHSTYHKEVQKSLGKCPKCGRTQWWLNDIPLKGFCWGPELNEHEEVVRVVPEKYQSYK